MTQVDFAKYSSPEEQGSDRQTWMVSFGDLTAILLTFMIIGFAVRGAVTTEAVQERRDGSDLAAIGQMTDTPVVRLAREAFPDLVNEDAIRTTSDGVELVLDATMKGHDEAQYLADFLSHLNNDLVIRVSTKLPAQNPSAVQRRLAWERGLAEAFELRARLEEAGLASQLRISVVEATGKKSGPVLKIAERSAL